jgi:uroporphyrin-III C-methyltransferase
MSEKTTPADSPGGSSAEDTLANTPLHESPTDQSQPARQERRAWGLPVLALLVIAALLAGLWWQQERFNVVTQEIAQRLQASDERSARAEQLARQASSLASAQRDTITKIEQRLRITANELAVLEQAWQTANKGLDQTLLVNDLRRLLMLANQQLALMGNVDSAIAIMESVLQLLEGHNLPQLAGLQQAVLTDLSRLRIVPAIDLGGLSAKLDSLIALTGKAPLLVPDGVSPRLMTGTPPATAPLAQPSSPPATAPTDADPWWQRWSRTGVHWVSESGRVLSREFADVVSIRRANDPQALLLSEEQALQLRANVRSMLLSAQLSLLMRQASIWRSELSEVESLLNTRYETDALDTKAALRLVRELLAAPLAVQLPAITDSLSALASAERALTTQTPKSGEN